MNWIRRDHWSLLSLGGSGGLTALFWSRLGPELPIHFNIHGEADRFVPTPEAVAIWLALLLAIYVLTTFLPRIDPFWRRVRERYDVILALRDLLLVIFAVFYALTLYAGVRGQWDPHWILFVMGALFIGL